MLRIVRGDKYILVLEADYLANPDYVLAPLMEVD